MIDDTMKFEIQCRRTQWNVKWTIGDLDLKEDVIPERSLKNFDDRHQIFQQSFSI